MKKRRYWLPIEVDILTAVYPDRGMAELVKIFGREPRSIWNKAQSLGLHRSAAYLASDEAKRLRKGHKRGLKSRFPKGNVPHNKGCTHRPGWAPGRMAANQFKKGHLGGNAKQLLKPIGAERLSRDGYLERKVNNDLPMQRRWRAVHLIEWEAINGPLPDGHCLCFRDGNTRHIALANLELVSRADRMRRNSIHNYPEPLKDVMRLRGKLARTIDKRQRRRAGTPTQKSQGAKA